MEGTDIFIQKQTLRFKEHVQNDIYRICSAFARLSKMD